MNNTDYCKQLEEELAFKDALLDEIHAVIKSIHNLTSSDYETLYRILNKRY